MKLGKKILYRRADLDRWFDDQLKEQQRAARSVTDLIADVLTGGADE